MDIELLYWDGCPSHPEALEVLEEVPAARDESSNQSSRGHGAALGHVGPSGGFASRYQATVAVYASAPTSARARSRASP
jgi:hypothetical protein